jgi:hypothetical protein
MKDVNARRECPPTQTLIEWFDGTLAEPQADVIEQHLDRCDHCRQSLLDWSGRAGAHDLSPLAESADKCAIGAAERATGGSKPPAESHESPPRRLQTPAPEPLQWAFGDSAGRFDRAAMRQRPKRGAASECPDAETLVAYGTAPAAVESTAAVNIERHLQQCERCVDALRTIMTLHRQMLEHEGTTEAQVASAAVSAAVPFRGALKGQRQRLVERTRQWWDGLRAFVTPSRWPPAALATATAIVLAIGVSRLLLPGAQFQEMRGRGAGHIVTVEVTTDTAGHARPAVSEPVVVPLPRGTRARFLETAGDWTRLELTDGRRVWVQKQAIAEVQNE